MEAKAQTRYLRVTAQKARRVVNLVRGQNAVEAAASLKFQPQAVAVDVRKLIESAIANARVKAEQAGERFDETELVITQIMVDEGPTMKRIQPRAQGRANQILKRSCHITVTVATPVAVKEGV
ncbi:50S ribosomal protein L22 [Demequina zhanjiangensis]|uniref:Large ribosomal subunit protein uL22 n=1 Tax=Demequina zhanjiangensis TaxID=3051659 RepID=A0ABT8FX82_9MICO|nr:50S ribosomal protein L22 [Demequina sp. SYSU T00b26]MDN4471511.1 50S ribosomal protein L22 [Demequina sp. SYSU T00b26]